jgi:hypothetical protein
MQKETEGINSHARGKRLSRARSVDRAGANDDHGQLAIALVPQDEFAATTASSKLRVATTVLKYEPAKDLSVPAAKW